MKKINILAILIFSFAIIPCLIFYYSPSVYVGGSLLDIFIILFFYTSPLIALILGIIFLTERENSSRLFILLALIGAIIAITLEAIIIFNILSAIF